MTRRELLLVPLAAAANGQQIFDLLLKNGNVIDPVNRRNGRMDVALIGDRIAQVGVNLPASHARLVIDASRYFVTPGLIDIRAHLGDRGVVTDHNTLTSGVTTVVDAGSSGPKDFDAFKASVIDRSKTQVLAFLDVAGDPEAAARTAQRFPREIVGIAAANAESIETAVIAAQRSPIVCPLNGRDDDVMKRLRPGDITTHIYARESPAGSKDARKRGVLLDTGSFLFRIAVPAIQQGLLPDTISTDIDKTSIMLPRANMVNTMSKFLNMGMTVEQIIERTTANPARAIRRAGIGALSDGAAADIALLEVEQGSFGYLDSGHRRLAGSRRLRCVLTVRNGVIVWDSEGLSATDTTKAGPYSNFK